MEPTPTPYSFAQLAMAAQFKQQPRRSPIDPSQPSDAQTSKSDKIPFSVHVLEKYLTRDQSVEITMLLMSGPSRWERSYLPVPAEAGVISEVIISCCEELCWIVLKPVS